MSDQTNQERELAALRIAREDGARQATIDGKLNSHEERLNAINGSIRRHANSVEQLSGKVDELVQEQRTRNALEAERAKALKQANERQISTRTFVLGVIAILIPLIALLLSIQGGAH